MAIDQLYVWCTGGLILGLIASQVLRRTFDPFAPIWIFLAGYFQLYVVQAISYRDWALRARGAELVTQANLRALWGLLWFLFVYYCGISKRVARRLPAAPAAWSSGLITTLAPLMVIWGLICSGITLRNQEEMSAEETLFRQFPLMMLVAGILLIVTGRQRNKPQPLITAAGLAVTIAYCLIWMFNAKRSHSMYAVLTGVAAFYLPRMRRPSLPMLTATALACMLVVSLALGWRGTTRYEQSWSGFAQYVRDFEPKSILVNLNLLEPEQADGERKEEPSKETEEYGAYLLMMAVVPDRSPYDYGASYLRVFTTYIPRIIWRDKPLYGRSEWIAAWIEGSEFSRDATFTGPAIGILGATQLNGGALATLIVLGLLAALTRTAYDYFRFHCDTPWAQAWWALTYYNAWLMTANDDPMIWFYYLYGHTTLAPLAALWLVHKFALASPDDAPAASWRGPARAAAV